MSDIPQDIIAAALKCANTALRNLDGTDFRIEITAIATAIMDERERAAKICEEQAVQFLSPQYSFNQPLGSFTERFACEECAAAIRKGVP